MALPQFHRGAFFCHYAAVAGNLKLLRWLRELEYEFGPLVTRGAAMGGHLDVLKWAVEHGAEWGPWCGCFPPLGSSGAFYTKVFHP
jgi:hypothetical protein